MSIFYKIFFASLFFLSAQYCVAQVQSSPAADTMRSIDILRAKSQRQITINDTTVLQTLAGQASVKQGGTILDGDSIILNQLTGIAEVFGNVHINDGDTMHTYAQYLRYLGHERMAYLKNNVKLTDGKAILTTQDLVYNIATGIATYTGGGKVINDKTVLTSEEGTYYSDTKDVVFKNNVHMVDPKYNMTADSLRYNTEFKTAYFIAPTHIISSDGIIDTRSGSYNLETGNAIFDSQSSFSDSTRHISGKKLAYESATGIIQVEGNGKFVDSTNNVIVLGDQLLIDKKKNTFLATRKPVMILYKDGDSTYIAADTLFSGLRKYDSTESMGVKKTDTLKKDSASAIVAKTDSFKIKMPIKKDSLDFASKLLAVTENTLPKKDSVKQDSLSLPVKKNDLVIKDTLKTDTTISIIKTIDTTLKDSSKIDTALPAKHPDLSITDSLKTDPLLQSKKDTVVAPKMVNTNDTITKPTAINLDKVSKDSVRYFLGFHHVRIYNDSLQAVSDSMHYSTEDSTFKLFGHPVFWNDSTQVKGDTMYMYTENQKAKRLYVFFNAIAVNRTKEGLFNQMGGRTINAYFKDGTVDYIRVKGSPAESIFYPQDDDSAYVGLNRSKGDVIDIFFVKKELNKIKFINDVDGTLFPMRQIPEDQKYLKNFIWEDNRRPKNKLELFE
ncbi:MAG: OstA-like protein [Ferruginibacter sp.]